MVVKDVMYGKTPRKSFARYAEILEMPNLLEVQKTSYQWFLDVGLREVFKDVGSIVDYGGNLELSFVDFSMDEKPKYDVEECKARDATYAAPIKVRVQLRNTNSNNNQITQQEIFMGDFPIMTEAGTFVINGAERVIVSQIVRSPGMYYTREVDKADNKTYATTVIPGRGAWLEYETDLSDIFYVRIDKNRKLPVTCLIRALGPRTDPEIIALFGEDDRILSTLEKDSCKTYEEAMLEIYRKLRPGEPPTLDSAETLVNATFFDHRRYDLSTVGRYKFNKKMALWTRLTNQKLAQPIADPRTGEILAETGEVLTRDRAQELDRKGVNEAIVDVDNRLVKVFSNNMVRLEDYVDFDPAEAGIDEMVHFPTLCALLDQYQGDELRNAIRRSKEDLIPNHITVEDIMASINYLNCLANGIGTPDDIDHLGNRRLRCVGELIQNQFRIGFSRMERVIRERMTTQDLDVVTPQSLINIRPVTAAIKEFFGSSPLSQFMDQTNPLAELTHKRRLSALGPGGLSRDRASFDVRDVHYSHYGRLCPIETPEGPNIGLISYLASYARINKYGFIEAPYRKVDKETGRLTDEITYMTADVEDEYIIGQATEPVDADNCLLNERVTCRHRNETISVDKHRVDFVDVSPKMMVSVATAMIPFLQNDDANRALMGANMQRQAVPLLRPEAPIVATGQEHKNCIDSEVAILAEGPGTVTKVDARRITVAYDNGQTKEYKLTKYLRSNHTTCINQRPVVEVGDRVFGPESVLIEDENGQKHLALKKDVKEGAKILEQGPSVLADGPSTDHGEVALGRNILMGFMTWEGYNYEDAILLNERMVKDDVFTSIHIEEYETEARDTKLGPETITRDIPNVGEDALNNLDEHGIIRVGAEIRAGDYLVGKVTPKGEAEATAEEKLLRAIFGEKAREVRDTSLKVPHGEAGIVVDVKVFTREGGDELGPGVNQVVRVYIAQKRKISVGDKMAGRHGNKGVVSRIMPQEDMPFLPDGTPLDIVLNPLGVPSRMNIGQVLEVHLGYAARTLGWKVATPIFNGASEQDIQECLKLAGLAREVGVNEPLIGKQLYLTGEEGEEMRPLTPEEMADDKQIAVWQSERRLRLIDGKNWLYDGRTGNRFDNPVTVGYVYFLKLHHLVDDKIHARSTGPYSLVTQQPLGGKAQFGGQRFGEMEVWALEAYGAAYTLQEILTVKSDDVTGRVKTYEAIVKGLNVPKPGVPESFKVLIKELQSLCLDMKVLDKDGAEIELKDDEDDGYQPVKDDYYDREEEFAYQADDEFASAGGFTFKGDSDDDDLTVDTAEEEPDDALFAEDDYN